MPELKPCPFCGGEPISKIWTSFDGDINHQIKHECGDGFSIRIETANMLTKEAAIAAWNKRVKEREE
jgi:hypothetical protein